MKYHALFVYLFLKKQQNLKLSSAENNRWRFRGESKDQVLLHVYIALDPMYIS